MATGVTTMSSSMANAVRHTFNLRDPGGPPLGLGRMSARDQWRYAQSLSRFRARYGEPQPLIAGEIGLF